MITIAVDAMGGDIGLSVTVPASVAFLERQNDVKLLMVGDEAKLQAALKSVNAPMGRISVIHASEVVDMDEDPRNALRHKKDSSMRVAINQVKEGLAEAAVSAGNTGALMAREIGARPMRSRHCNEEQGQTMPLVKFWEGLTAQ